MAFRALRDRCWALLAMAGMLSAVPAGAATIKRVSIADGQVVVSFDGPVATASAGVLAAARQIAVDIDGALPGRPAIAKGLVTRIDQVRRAAGTRLLLDLAAPAVVGDGAFDATGRQLTLSLRQVDSAHFADAAATGPISFFPFNLAAFGSRLASSSARVSIPIPPAAKSPPLPRIQGDNTRPLVVIDPGHGGADPGAINPVNHLREKDLTLKIARAIRDELLASGRVRVALTRSDDRFLVLRERFGIARRLHADLFISIHCDSTGTNDQATGASVYTLSDVASDKEAARLAARENKADIIAGVNLGDAGADVSSILIDLTQRETMNASATFARLLGREAKDLVPMRANFHRQASLMVLKAPDMPSVLFETGYISNPDDAEFLNSKEGEQRIADAVRSAVEVHFARRLADK